MRLHEKLQASTFPNCRKLANELEVSTKTIQRDIEFMRDRLEPADRVRSARFGSVYTEPVTRPEHRGVQRRDHRAFRR